MSWVLCGRRRGSTRRVQVTGGCAWRELVCEVAASLMVQTDLKNNVWFNWQPVEVLEVSGDAILSVAVSEELGSKVQSGACAGHY